MSKIQDLKDGKYVQAWVAKQLYPSLGERSAISKLHNKLFNKQGRKLNAEELKEIENILK